MDRSDSLSPPPQAPPPASLDGLARKVVTALDGIFGHLMAQAPAEGAGPETPLTFSEVRAIKMLPPVGTVSMRVLAEALGVALPTATHLVDRLVEKGVVERIRPEYDRRVVLVGLSEKSKAHREALFNHRVGLVAQIIEPLGPAVREQVARTFNEIAQAAASQAKALSDTASQRGGSPTRPVSSVHARDGRSSITS